MTSLVPLNDNLVVKRDIAAEESEGGIILTTKARSKWGTVVAVGPGRRLKDGTRVPLDFNVGDHVLLAALGAEIHHEGEDFVIMRDKDILVKE